jgi:hypothetical protein
MNLQLLLAHADDSTPLLEGGLPLESAAAAPRPTEGAEPTHLSDISADPDDLSLQRWGVLAPEGAEGDRLLDLIAPLVRAREAEQGAPARVYRVAPGMDATSAVKWKNNVYWDERVPEQDLPRYLLVLGDLDQVSLELQQLMASNTFIGRLAGARDGDYAAYVEKVLAWAKTPSPEAAARSLYCTVRDMTDATTVGFKALMEPMARDAQRRAAEGRLPAREILGLELDPDDARTAFLEQVTRADPTILCTMSHGLGAPRGGWRSLEQQRALQGAMSLGAGQHLSAEDLAGPFLPGGMWFYLACYGGGTPETSAYYHWLGKLQDAGAFGGSLGSVLSSLPKEGERPFVGALPRTLLANPKGPLGVIAHCDLAWTYAFQDLGPEGGSRVSRFQGVFSSLARRHRQGVAYHNLLRFFAEKSVELSVLYDEEARLQFAGDGATEDEARAVKKANLWMARQDLGGYVLFGDPAVRLPLAEPTKAAAPSASSSVSASSLLGFSVQTSATPATSETPATPAPEATAGPLRDGARMEEAVHAVLSGEEAEKAIAARHGISRAELTRWVEVYREAGRAALSRLS